MKVKSLFLIGTMTVASMVTSGCGSDTTSSLGRFFSKPFAKAGSGDEMVAESDETAPGKENKMSQVAGANYRDPGKPDVAFATSALDEEYDALVARQELEEQRLHDYREKAEELQRLIHEYEGRHSDTLKRTHTIKKIRKMLNEDPSMINKIGEEGSTLMAKTPSPAIKDDIMNMEGSSGWTPSDVPAGAKSAQGPAFAPSLSMDDTDGSFFSSPPSQNGKSGSAVDMVTSGTHPKADAEADSKKTLKATVLAMDGEGEDATLILGAGQRSGVTKGMLFGFGEGDSQTVLVVTKVFPTYCRAMPHPKFGRLNVKVREKVTQLSSLPR